MIVIDSTATGASVHAGRLPMLDGWRALSILLVLAAHLLPLNIIWQGANETAGVAGMAIFFTLSGFLITRFLLDRLDIRAFLIRRAMRIMPLAWVIMILIFWLLNSGADSSRLVANLLFYANLPPQRLLEGGGPLWSLCIEMQFYFGVAMLVFVGGRRALLSLPLLAIIVTILRVTNGTIVNIVTWYRADEIFAGATIALISGGLLGTRTREILLRFDIRVTAPLALLVCACWENPLGYLRPYAVAAMVGGTIWRAPLLFRKLMESKPATYVAEISYAVYVLHGVFGATWLGTGDILEKYLKRPLLLLATFATAHFSTYYFERPFIRLSQRLTPRPRTIAV